MILGGSVGGLSYARSLGRRGIPVICLGSDPSPLRPSRYVKFHSMPAISGHEEKWIQTLSLMGRDLSFAALFPTGDDGVFFISEHADELTGDFRFNVSDPETLAKILDKKLQYQEALQAGVPVPQTFFPDEQRIESIASRVSYPCLLKPRHSKIWRLRVGAKLTVVESSDELIRTYHSMRKLDPKVMVQERIGGGDEGLYGFLAYYDGTSRCLAGMTKRKLRQNPPIYGDGSLQVSVWEPEVEKLARRLLDHFHFRGLVGVEFKEDPADGLFKLIEVNPRSVSGNGLAVASGMDLPFIAYRDVLGLSVDIPSSFKKGVRLVNELWDFRSFRTYRSRGELRTGTWIRSIIGPNTVYAYFAWDDPMPFIFMVARTASGKG